jgi:hypothetical protein
LPALGKEIEGRKVRRLKAAARRTRAPIAAKRTMQSAVAPAMAASASKDSLLVWKVETMRQGVATLPTSSVTSFELRGWPQRLHMKPTAVVSTTGSTTERTTANISARRRGDKRCGSRRILPRPHPEVRNAKR